MRKHAVVLTLTLLELLALVLLAFFWLVMRPDLLATYGIVEGDVAPSAFPMATRIALTTALVPLVGAVGAVLFVSAWLWRRSVPARNRLLGVALVLTVLGLAWAVWAAYAPAFERLE
jgi:flagellar biogenesis protein FliO